MQSTVCSKNVPDKFHFSLNFGKWPYLDGSYCCFIKKACIKEVKIKISLCPHNVKDTHTCHSFVALRWIPTLNSFLLRTSTFSGGLPGSDGKGCHIAIFIHSPLLSPRISDATKTLPSKLLKTIP